MPKNVFLAAVVLNILGAERRTPPPPEQFLSAVMTRAHLAEDIVPHPPPPSLKFPAGSISWRFLAEKANEAGIVTKRLVTNRSGFGTHLLSHACNARRGVGMSSMLTSSMKKVLGLAITLSILMWNLGICSIWRSIMHPNVQIFELHHASQSSWNLQHLERLNGSNKWMLHSPTICPVMLEFIASEFVSMHSHLRNFSSAICLTSSFLVCGILSS